MTTEAGALDGLTVLDLTRFPSGPYATLLLAGMGATVIKVDDPCSGEPIAGAPPFSGPRDVSLDRQDSADLGPAYLKPSRGKHSTTADLEQPRGRALRHPDGSASQAVMAGMPFRFSRSTVPNDNLAPVPGGDTRALLQGYPGLDDATLEALASERVITWSDG